MRWLPHSRDSQFHQGEMLMCSHGEPGDSSRGKLALSLSHGGES
jgi:hypothetical protein